MALGRWPVVNNIVALAGGGQAGATPLRDQAMNRVTTVATAADSVMLPKAIKGSHVVVVNAAAANAMAVFPRSGNTINALAADASLSVAANKVIEFFCFTSGKWYSNLTA